MKIGFYEIAAVLVVLAIAIVSVAANWSWKQDRRAQESFQQETRRIVNDLKSQRLGIRPVER